MKIVCSSFEETLFAVRVASETATLRPPARELRAVPMKPTELQPLPPSDSYSSRLAQSMTLIRVEKEHAGTKAAKTPKQLLAE